VEPGKDLSELLKGTTIKVLKLEYAEKEWEFHYRDVLWQEHFQSISDNWEHSVGTDGSPSSVFNFGKYYESMLMKMLTRLPDGSTPVPSVIRQLTSDVIGKLTKIVPSPNLERGVVEAKKA
jgi:hypothetical protein